MKAPNRIVTRPSVVTCFVLLMSCAMALAETDKYACAEPNPQSLCNSSNTCGSSSSPCTVDVKRDGDGASATPDITGAKGNSTFCVKAGTTIVWESTQKNTGFVVDFGTSSPFGSDDAIIGGAKRSVSVTAMKPGCYKYSAGACISGEIQGMCGSGSAEAIILPSGAN
jgi:plastocyanin